jgi:predicted GNAT family acetyltransferase
MRVVHYTDGAAFAQRVEALLTAEEVENNLILGVIAGIRAGTYDNVRMMAVEDEGEPHLAAVMTAPYKLVLSKAEDAALQPLVDDLRARGLAPPGVNGLAEVCQAFAERWRQTTGQGVTCTIEMQLYTLRQVTSPRPVPGALRPATRDDLETVVAWLNRFSDEVHVGRESRDLTQTLAARQINQGRLFLWQDGGAPVSLAGCHDIPPKGVRIGPVYTPPEARGKGYASACVGGLARRLLDDGKTWCGIFADLANPASNRIYQRLGFKEACRYREYTFEADPVSPASP